MTGCPALESEVLLRDGCVRTGEKNFLLAFFPLRFLTNSLHSLSVADIPLRVLLFDFGCQPAPPMSPLGSLPDADVVERVIVSALAEFH